MLGQSLGEAEKFRQGRTNLRQNGGGVRRDDGACGGDAVLHDGAVVRAMFHVGVGYAGADAVHENCDVEGVGNVGESGTGLCALGAADEAGQGAVAAGGYASANGDVGANGGGWVSGSSIELGICLSPCCAHSSQPVPSLPCAARPPHPNLCFHQTWNPRWYIRVPCWGQIPFLALAALSRAGSPNPDHVG